jgi:RHS repeat-associated protein
VIGLGNRLLNDGAGSTYEYDKEGNRTKKTTGTVVTTYTWDQRNRLTGATTKNGATTTALGTFVYDAFNRRSASYVDPDGAGAQPIQPKRFWYDGDQLQGQLSNVTVSDRFLMGPGIDNVIADEKAGTIHWTLTDIRGSVREVVDSTGASNTRKQYDAFGVKTNAVGTTDTVFAYTGRDGEDPFGLQYNRNRWYDPAAKRWLSEDPIGFAGGDSNLNRYVGNGPTNATDPDGYEAIAIGPNGKRLPNKNDALLFIPILPGVTIPVPLRNFTMRPDPAFAQKMRDQRAREARANSMPATTCELYIDAIADVRTEGLKEAQKNMNRIGGVAQAGFGAVEAYVAAPLLVLAPPLGAAIMLHAMDNFYHGVESAITNRHSPTYTERGISQGLQRAGLSKGAADFLGGIGNGLIGAGATAAAAKLREAWLGMQGQTQGKGLKGLICDEGAASPVGPRIPPDVIASEHLGPGHFLNHGDPNKWKFLGRKPVPATGRGFDKGTKKVYDVYLDENGCQVEMHYWQKLDGTIFGERFEQAGSTTIP